MIQGPLSNPVPRSNQNAYEPDEPGRDYLAGDPPVMRPSDGSAAKAAVAKSGIAQRPAPKVK